jgi:hypothetical protein
LDAFDFVHSLCFIEINGNNAIREVNMANRIKQLQTFGKRCAVEAADLVSTLHVT